MSEHKIGEQWIEVIDGKRRMLKAVESVDIGACTACDFEGQEIKCAGFPNSICGSNSNSFIIKDLGILNDDGLLPCPSCWEYPTLKEELDEHDERIYAVEHECNIYMTTGWNHDRQTVIDAWNRRV